MHRIAGEEDAPLAVAIGEQKVLPPRRARQHLVFDRNADGPFERRFHLLVAVDHGMQRPVPGRVLHDQERRLVVGDMIVAALAGPVADRQPLEQFVAAIQRLPQRQQIALAGQARCRAPCAPGSRRRRSRPDRRRGFPWYAPSAVRTRAVTPSPSCRSDKNSQPNRTVTEGMVSAIDFNSGSSVYCEIS